MKTTKPPTHPGLIVREEIIKAFKVSVTEAAKCLGVTRNTLSALLNTKASLSPEMAVRIGKATRTPPAKWLELQVKYDLWKIEHKAIDVGDLTVNFPY